MLTSINLTYNHTAPECGWTAVDTAVGLLTPQMVILTVTVSHTGPAALAFVTVRGTDPAGDMVVATLHDIPQFICGLADEALTDAATVWHTHHEQETAA